MKFWKLFAVPEGKGITEKHLYRVLVSSVCGILLCMGCLAGSTWAWFAVSVENTENVLQIGMPAVVLTIDGSEFASGTQLGAGEYSVNVMHANAADVFDQKSVLYVTFFADQSVAGYVKLDFENRYEGNIRILTDKDCVVSWAVSWFAPDHAEPLKDWCIDLSGNTESEPTEDMTEETGQEEAEPTGESGEGTTESGDSEADTTEVTTEPPVQTSEPIEESSDPIVDEN